MPPSIKWEVFDEGFTDVAAQVTQLHNIFLNRNNGVYLSRKPIFFDIMSRYHDRKNSGSEYFSLSVNQIKCLISCVRQYRQQHKLLCEVSKEFPGNEKLKRIRATMMCTGGITKAQKEIIREIYAERDIDEMITKGDCGMDFLE